MSDTARASTGFLALIALLAGCAQARVTPQPISIESLCSIRTDQGSHGRHHPVLSRFVDDRIAGDSAGSLLDIGALTRNARVIIPSTGTRALQSTRALRTYIRAHGGGVIAYWSGLTVGTHGMPVDGTAFADGDTVGAGRASFVRSRGAQSWSFAHVDEPYDPVCE